MGSSDLTCLKLKKKQKQKKNEAEEKNIGNRSNIVANSIMTSKRVHIRKKKLKKK